MRSQVKRVEKSRLSDQIIRQILSLIEKGKLKVGDKLPPEHLLMKQFGVGRSSLREAMGALSLMGVIDIRHGRGTYIMNYPPMTKKNLFDWNELKKQDRVNALIEARIILEEGIIGLIIAMDNHEDMNKLRNALTNEKLAMTNRKKYIRADWLFHNSLAEVSHNEILLKFLTALRDPITSWMERQTPEHAHRQIDISHKQHVAILEAIEARDIERAKSTLRLHLEVGAQTELQVS